MAISRREWIKLSGSTVPTAMVAPQILAKLSAAEQYQGSIAIDGPGFPGSI